MNDTLHDGLWIGLGWIIGVLAQWATELWRHRWRKPRFEVVVVGRETQVAAPIGSPTFQELATAQEWCRRMNATQDWVTSLDTHPPGRTTTFYDVRAWPFRPEQEVPR